MPNSMLGPESIAHLLDRPIAYQRAFVDLGAGITGAVFLSQAVYWSKRTDDDDGWFWKTQDEWAEETGLSRAEQEGARGKLRQIGILVEKKKGLPCKLWFRIDFNELAKSLAAINASQASMRKSSRLDTVKVADSDAENKQSSTETTTEITTEIKRDTPPASRSAPAPSADLIVRDPAEPTETHRSRKAVEQNARGTRLPDDWSLSVDLGNWAMTEGLTREQVMREAETFRDYWVSKPGAGGRKSDWGATWRNWIRKSGEYRRGGNHGERQHRETPFQASLREAEEIMQRARDGTLGPEWDFSNDGDDMFGAVRPAQRALPAQGGDGVPGEAARRITNT